LVKIESGGLRNKGILRGGGDKPFISIVIAVLNRVKCVGRAIESVARQTYDNVELVIVDGGSTDGTVELLKKYDDVIDCWISEPDHGIYDALNKGVKLARGDWINIQGSDDFLFDSLDKMALHLRSECTVYYGDLFYHYQKKIRFGKQTAYKLANHQFGHHRYFFPCKYFDIYSYNINLCICADYEMVVRSYFDKNFAFEYVPIVVSEYNELDGASFHLVDYEFERIRYQFLRSKFPIFYVIAFYLRKYIAEKRRRLTTK